MAMTSYLHAGAGLLIVLGLIVLAAFIARKLGLGGAGINRADRRLAIVESMALDPKRRVLLIKCDYTEHLVLLGPNSETVLSGRPPSLASGASAPESQSRQPVVSAGGPAMLTTKPAPAAAQPQAPSPARQVRDQPSTWAKRTGADNSRREPQLGPLPTDRKPK
jgi:flagellar protein FliO/FliZ